MMNDKTANNKQEVLQSGNLLVACRSEDASVSRSNIRTVMNAAGGVVQANNYYLDEHRMQGDAKLIITECF